MARDADSLTALLRNCLQATFIGFICEDEEDELASIKNIFMPCLQTLWRGKRTKNSVEVLCYEICFPLYHFKKEARKMPIL